MKSYDLELEDDLTEADSDEVNGFLFSLPFWIVSLVLLAKVILSHV
jgi:hypothetical protein